MGHLGVPTVLLPRFIGLHIPMQIWGPPRSLLPRANPQHGMASQAALNVEVTQMFAMNYIQNCSSVACACILLYDWTLTLPDEVELIWKNKWSGTSVIFALNRLMMLAFSLVLLVLVFGNYTTISSCKAVESTYYLLIELIYVVWAMFSALRIYAISGRMRSLALLSVCFNAGPIIIDSVQIATTDYSLYPLGGEILCFASLPWSPRLKRGILDIASRIFPQTADILVLTVTWWKTYHVFRATKHAGIKQSLASVFLRDGTLYFSVFFVINIIEAVVESLSTDIPTGVITNFLQMFALVVISRFIISLRRVADSGNDSGHARSELPPTVRFASDRIIGNMGEELVTRWELHPPNADADAIEDSAEGHHASFRLQYITRRTEQSRSSDGVEIEILPWHNAVEEAVIV